MYVSFGLANNCQWNQMQERMRSLVFEKTVTWRRWLLTNERKQAKTTTAQGNIMYRDFDGLMYIRIKHYALKEEIVVCSIASLRRTSRVAV